jgi:hypothetical protein
LVEDNARVHALHGRGPEVTDHDYANSTLRRWREDPASMVREEFGAEPDPWQLEPLHLFPTSPRLAMKACKGPGKTTILAWLILNFLGTRPHPRIAATSITEANIDANLWPELAKWIARSPFFSATFTWTKNAVLHKAHSATWWAQKRTWPKAADPAAMANALAGLHSDYVMVALDESGGIPLAVAVTVDAIFASAIEAHAVQAGNPEKLDGALYAACTTQRHLWRVITITGDPDNPKAWVHHGRARQDVSKGGVTPLQWAQEQIGLYGRENPWVMVNVLGEFPPSSINALLGAEEVEKAMARHLPTSAYDWAQKRLGIDVARFGDDRTVIFPRQGLASFRPLILRNARTTAIAARAAKAITDFGQGEEVLTFVDDTGHWGHGVIDNLITAGYGPIPVIYSDPAIDPRYRNRRAEFWMLGAEWVKGGGALPPIPEMIGELITPTYSFINGKFVIEPKEMIKARLGRSPDLADALFQTFAIADMPNSVMRRARGTRTARHNADPFEGAGTVESDFDPSDWNR